MNESQGIEAIIEEINQSRRKAFEMKLKPGETYESKVAEEVDRLRSQLNFLQDYVSSLISLEPELVNQVIEIESETGQNLEEEKFFSEIWNLRYSFLSLWFMQIFKPNSQNELEVLISLIDRSFESFEITKTYLPNAKKQFAEFAGMQKLEIGKLKKIEDRITNAVAAKISRAGFDCTGGRLAGELHDFVVTTLMKSVEQDRNIFEGRSKELTKESIQNIQVITTDLKKNQEKQAKSFFKKFFKKTS